MYWTLERQLAGGKLVSPRSGLPLEPDPGGAGLRTVGGGERFKVLGTGVPLLVADEAMAAGYADASEKMAQDYRPETLSRGESAVGRLKAFLPDDRRTASSVADLQSIFEGLPADALCLSIGGGPKRAHPSLLNLNIGPFPNVDIVADAHSLPYADGSVDAIHCEAVLEHLRDPWRAVSEMRRVLKTGGKVYACTPFMQAYHGYPFHFQNFTLTGHVHLFAASGFEVVNSGVCVGPVNTMVSLGTTFIQEYSPGPLRWPLKALFVAATLALRPADRLLNTRKNAHVLASTTYLVAEKAVSGAKGS